MPRIRAPYEFNDGPINNNYRPVRIDEEAVVAPARAATQAFRTVGEIVNHAAEAAHRNNAAADATQLESELERIQRELDSEPIPDGNDPEKWIRDMPARFQRRAEQARANILRARGVSATARYNEYFGPLSTQVMARVGNASSERAQQRIVDWGRGAVIENVAVTRARALDPDATQEDREAQAVRTRQIYEEAVRDGLLSRTEGESSIAQFNGQYTEFNNTQGRAARALRTAREIQSATNDPVEQLRRAREIEDPILGEAVAANILQDINQTRAAREAQVESYEQAARNIVERNPANWQSIIDPEQLRVLRENDRTDALRATARSILMYGPNGNRDLPGEPGSAARVAVRGPDIARLFEMNMSEAATFLTEIPLDSALNEAQAQRLNALFDRDYFAEGMRLSESMRNEDILRVANIQMAVRNGGVYPFPGENDPQTIEEEMMDGIVAIAVGRGIIPGENNRDTRVVRQQFDMWARNALRTMWATGPNGAVVPVPIERADMLRIVNNAARRVGTTSRRQFQHDISASVTGAVGGDDISNAVPAPMIRAAMRNLMANRREEWLRANGNPNARGFGDLNAEERRMVREELGRMFDTFNDNNYTTVRER